VARAALPHATRALCDPDPEIRISGARAIELFATDADESIGDLARALSDPVASVRVAVLGALAELGPSATAAAPEVALRLVHGSTVEERSAAAYTLGNLSAQTDHLDALLDALLHDLPPVQAGAASALADALEDEDEGRRERVSRALHGLSRTK
jgi:HEAT repeat protein